MKKYDIRNDESSCSRVFVDGLALNEFGLTKAVEDLLRERNELAAQVERLRGVVERCVTAVEDAHYGWEGDCGVINKVNVIADSVLDETPSQSLEAVKREWAESVDSVLEGFAFTTSDGQWVVHRDDVSELLSK